MTPLERDVRAMIAMNGPITVEHFMDLALSHPLYGYYRKRDPLGAAGDFTTAPEISQMFGELLALWAAEVWTFMGSPAPLRLIELGPGRGTLMADALRAAQVVPRFLPALDVHLVETSPVLTETQRKTLARAQAPVSWQASVEDVPDGPAIVFANEFFDVLPVRHYVKTDLGWCEKLVGISADDALIFGVTDQPDPVLSIEAPVGSVLEIAAAAHLYMAALAERLVRSGGAALVVDYGHMQTQLGETLQAMKAHQYVDPLEEPGEADLTAHVDFAGLARAARSAGAIVCGPLTQGQFLSALGIFERANGLKQSAGVAQREAIDAALKRLVGTDDTDMGTLFKVMAVASPDLPPLPGFGEPGA